MGSSFRLNVAPRAFLVAGLTAEGYSFGASDPIDVGGGQSIYEPDSETVNVSFEAGLGFRF